MYELNILLGFYLHPVQNSRNLLFKSKLKWFYPSAIYLISFILTFIMILIMKEFNNNVRIFHILWFYPYWTLPYILILTLMGTLFYNEFKNRFQFNFYYSILIASYGIIISFILYILSLLVKNIDEFIYDTITGIIFVFPILFTRIIFNIKLFTLKKKRIWIMSIVEMMVIFVLINIISMALNK